MRTPTPTRREFFRKFAVGAALVSLPQGLVSGTGPARQGGFTFAQICDPQLGMGGHRHDVVAFRRAIRMVNARKPAFAVICGDLVSRPTGKALTEFRELRDRFTVPCHCAAGNHDVENVPTAHSLALYRRILGKDYFSFEQGGFTICIVNTNLWKVRLAGESERHDAWLNKQLLGAREKGSSVFIVGHHPLFLEKPDEPEKYFNLPLPKRREILNLFEKSGVVAVLGGHTHRTIINTHRGIQLVNAETTSKNFDGRPLGFRIWNVADSRPYRQEFIPLGEIPEKPGPGGGWY